VFIIRPVKETDLEQLLVLAAETGPGMTSLPADPELLGKKIRNSVNSFKIEPIKPGEESYMFVLEEGGRLRACSAISAKIGGFELFYSYEIKTAQHKSEALQVDKRIEYLELITEHDGPTIISSLFVDPSERGKHYGKYMTLVRFLFMASFRQRFEDRVIAEMRGYIDPDGKSPFWEATVRHFMDMDFIRADYLSVKDKGFIADLMPHYPLYIPLLSSTVRDAIGAVHDETLSALRFLETQGFKWDRHVDIFDAGPRIASATDEIKAVRESVSAKADIAFAGGNSSKLCLITNTNLDFRAVVAALEYFPADNRAMIDSDTAAALNLSQGANLRFIAC